MWPGRAEADGMRNLPRFALVPLAALISALPLVVLPSPAGADTASDCEEAFSVRDGEPAHLHDRTRRSDWPTPARRSASKPGLGPGGVGQPELGDGLRQARRRHLRRRPRHVEGEPDQRRRLRTLVHDSGSRCRGPASAPASAWPAIRPARPPRPSGSRRCTATRWTMTSKRRHRRTTRRHRRTRHPR